MSYQVLMKEQTKASLSLSKENTFRQFHLNSFKKLPEVIV